MRRILIMIVSLCSLLATTTATAEPPAYWTPALTTTFQWQLTTPVDLTVNADMFDIDLFDNDASVVAALHAQGRKVVCYVSAGTWENWRPDAGQFPASVKGKSLDPPYTDEQWLDIRDFTAIGPIMSARFDLCQGKGFDAIEVDNVDGFANETGFPLTAQDQLAYNTWIAQQAHARGLSIALKNDGDQAAQLVSVFDWALVEQCVENRECAQYQVFIEAGKPVYDVEYTRSTSKFCTQTNAMQFSAMKKKPSLNAYRETCR